MNTAVICALKLEANAIAKSINNVEVRICGIGSNNAANFSKKIIASGATCLVNVGFCAGLDPKLKPGTLVVPDTLSNQHGDIIKIDNFKPKNTRFHTGIMLTSNSIIASKQEKNTYHIKYNAAAVDMESYYIAEQALAANVEFYCIKYILDPASYSLPSIITNWNKISLLKKILSTLYVIQEIPKWTKLISYYLKAKNNLMDTGNLLANGNFDVSM